jgi:hypothetical protein
MKNKKYRTLTTNEVRFVTDIVIMWKVTLDTLRNGDISREGARWQAGRLSCARQLYRWTSVKLNIDPKQFRSIWLSVEI